MAEMMVRRIGVLSLAKMQALLMFVIGLIIGVIYGLIFMIFGAALTAMAPHGQDAALGGGISTIVIGVVMMVAIPIFYGVLGFIFGLIGGFVYNLAAGVVGGIKLDLEATTTGYAPPPPPQQWAEGR
jgi:hypothetical protein